MSAFADLALNEIEHIVHVMHDADIDESEENDGQQTIKRQPTAPEATYENSLDTNNNNTLKSSTTPKGIPSVPRVHMGAGFTKIFNQCPLEIYCSYCWTDDESRGEQNGKNVDAFASPTKRLDQYVLFASEEGIYSLNLNEIHDASLELVSSSPPSSSRKIRLVVSETNDVALRARRHPLVDLRQIEFALSARSLRSDATQKHGSLVVGVEQDADSAEIRETDAEVTTSCLLYTSPSPRD